MLSTISWTGLGDGRNWSDSRNWSSNSLPGSSDDVLISLVGAPTIIYDASVGNTTIRSLIGSDSLSIAGGSLTIDGNSSLTGNLTINNAALSVMGTSVVFVANGPTSVDGSSLTAAGGATLSLPNVTSYTKSGEYSAYFEASDAGSLVDLPGLTSLSGLADWLRIYARSGGTVNLPHLATITNSYTDISADGAGSGNVPSTINLPVLTSFSDTTGNPYGYLSATNGGRVVNPLLTTTTAVNITVGTSGASTLSQISTSQLTSVTGGEINIYQNADLSGLSSLTNSGLGITGALAFSLPHLTTVDGSSLIAGGGATLSLPNVTSYAKSGEYSAYFEASDAGSLVDLPGLTSLSGLADWLRIYARSGGTVNLPHLATITNSYTDISADGSGSGNVPSTINLPVLTSFSDTGSPTVICPRPTADAW